MQHTLGEMLSTSARQFGDRPLVVCVDRTLSARDLDDAASRLAASLRSLGLGPDDRAIQNDVLTGWASAARESGELPLEDLVGWLTRRRDAVAAGRSSIRVGHVDFFARPTGTR